jgi:hypothetical protein
VKRNCDCHPWTEDDWKVWQIVKKEPRTRAQWEALHDVIERYRRLLIDDYKRAAGAVPPSTQEKP